MSCSQSETEKIAAPLARLRRQSFAAVDIRSGSCVLSETNTLGDQNGSAFRGVSVAAQKDDLTIAQRRFDSIYHFHTNPRCAATPAYLPEGASTNRIVVDRRAYRKLANSSVGLRVCNAPALTAHRARPMNPKRGGTDGTNSLSWRIGSIKQPPCLSLCSLLRPSSLRAAGPQLAGRPGRWSRVSHPRRARVRLSADQAEQAFYHGAPDRP